MTFCNICINLNFKVGQKISLEKELATVDKNILFSELKLVSVSFIMSQNSIVWHVDVSEQPYILTTECMTNYQQGRKQETIKKCIIVYFLPTEFFQAHTFVNNNYFIL